MQKVARRLLRPVARRTPRFVKRWWKYNRLGTNIKIFSGHPDIDRYLARGYRRVPGMSSRFAAAICRHIIQRQTVLGIAGDLIEIGTLEGRFFIAMALGLASGEHALGIDQFDWPDAGVEAHSLQTATPMACRPSVIRLGRRIVERLHRRPVRFIHIDGHHSPECLANDLQLATAVLHGKGVICLDDMLHPAYPLMITAVLDYFARH